MTDSKPTRRRSFATHAAMLVLGIAIGILLHPCTGLASSIETSPGGP